MKAAATSLILIWLSTACSKAKQPESEDSPAKPSAATSVEVSDTRASFGGAAIRGVVRFSGKLPEDIPIEFDEFTKTCKPLMQDQTVRLVETDDSNGIKNTFVYVLSGLPPTATYEPPGEVARVVNKDCLFSPKVLAIHPKQSFEMVNNDAVHHSFHTYEEGREHVEQITEKGQVVRHQFQGTQVMVLTMCDIHPWMHSYVAVLAHPFHTNTPADGRYELSRLPPGSYVIEFWHRSLGTKQVKVTLPADAQVNVDITFTEADLPKQGMRKVIRDKYGRLGWL